MTGDVSDLVTSPSELTRWLVDTPSVSGSEATIAGVLRDLLSGQDHLRLDRDGDALVARTDLGRPHRILLAGHLDTVPVADNLPARVEGDRLHGCGASDMKAGLAVMLHLAVTLDDPAHDLTFVLYDNEEVEAARNGLGRLARKHRDWLDADLAILMEPTDGEVEAGCQGTLRAAVRVTGRRAHSARSWLGENAIHAAGPLLATLASYQPRSVDIDGCVYREGLSAVGIVGGVAGNVVPDVCTVAVNFRFAPDRSEQQALDHVREVLAPYDIALTDSAPGALPGLDSPLCRQFLAAVGRRPRAKYGWTDVARFAALGVPALNYGPGDPNLAHTREEYVELPRIVECTRLLRAYLVG